METISEQLVAETIIPRNQNTQKSDYGRILIIAGNQNYGGAGIMSASAAVHAGAGLVTLATDPINFGSLHAIVPEAMVANYNEVPEMINLIGKSDVVIIGPGLGEQSPAPELLTLAFSAIKPEQVLIVDGSALALLAKKSTTLPKCRLILTPHQMEWERLSKIKIANQKPEYNQGIQQRLHATIILKQHRTQVYLKNGEVWENPVGNAAMATGGSGDSLTGIIAAFVAQFKPYDQAILAAVYSHSKIADELAENQYVTLPTQIIEQLPFFMKKMSEK